ncbi:MAG: hypothetical protein ACLQSR_17110 [Limisphaerales bacterium]
MKTCSYCGAEYPDDATLCASDHTPLDPPVKPSVFKTEQAPYEPSTLSEADKKLDLVTLMRCGTLAEADVIASRLRAAGIETFIPMSH